MIEQWVIDQLNPPKGEKLIILGDPQRMIRTGAQAVDGWAKEIGFTVLFCSGSLVLAVAALVTVICGISPGSLAS